MRLKLFVGGKVLVALHSREADTGHVADLCARGGDFFFFFWLSEWGKPVTPICRTCSCCHGNRPLIGVEGM